MVVGPWQHRGKASSAFTTVQMSASLTISIRFCHDCYFGFGTFIRRHLYSAASYSAPPNWLPKARISWRPDANNVNFTPTGPRQWNTSDTSPSVGMLHEIASWKAALGKIGYRSPNTATLGTETEPFTHANDGTRGWSEKRFESRS